MSMDVHPERGGKRNWLYYFYWHVESGDVVSTKRIIG
jgi:hypothetical protein